MIRIFFLLSWLVLSNGFALWGQALPNWYAQKQYQFEAYRGVKSWAVVFSDLNTLMPKVHIIDVQKYKGHANFVSKELVKGISFQTFKQQVNDPKNRVFIAAHLYDLKGLNGWDWGLRLVDYGLKDNPTQMAETLASCMKVLNATLPKTHGIVLVSGLKNVIPNNEVIPILKNRKVEAVVVNTILKELKIGSLEVLNAGVAVGYLKLMDDNKTTLPDFYDIPIYKRIPDRVPIVNGIITLEPQTPLSHVNLLAINRGTPNAYLQDLKQVPQLANSVDKLVKITFSKQNTLTVAPITEAEAKAFWQSREKVKVQVPSLNLSITDIVHFDTGNPSVQSNEVVGAKAANYAKIQHWLKDYVKPGFALPFSHYFLMLRANGLERDIEALISKKNTLSPQQLEEQLKQLRQKIKKGKLSDVTLQAVRALLNSKLKSCKKIRLRSSTNSEDLPDFNGAGLYESKGFLCKDTDDTLQKKILAVYASLWTVRAFEEREFFQINHQKVGMAILIHEAFTAEFANGVAITIPRAQGFEIAINSQLDDRLVTNPKDGETAEEILFVSEQSANFQPIKKSTQGTVFIQTPETLELLKQLKTITARLHKLIAEPRNTSKQHYGIDLEFKLTGTKNNLKLYIKQARLLNLGH